MGVCVRGVPGQVWLVTTAGAVKVMLQGQSKTNEDIEVQREGTSHRIIKCQV